MDILVGQLSYALQRIASILADPQVRTCWVYLVPSLILAIAVLAWHRSAQPASSRDLRTIFGTLFDRALWLHPSARTDYGCYLINATLGSLLRALGLVSGAVVSLILYAALLKVSGSRPLSLDTSIVALALYTLLSLLWQDFGTYVGHYALHRMPLLWEFHKVHHSAQVLTLVTVFRIHPCEVVFTGLISGLFAGSAGALGLFVFGSKIEPLSIMGLNAGVFLFYALGANLRHSHVWLPYPGWLSRIFISPAQHQIHHSSLPQHHDANFGVIFGLWDWMFRTLYVPASRESLVLGLINGEDRDYQSMKGLYFGPFRKAWARSPQERAPRR
jgi:sterol desaturase/sphingolipid hydroxylase (fatty acid hydroxylase superfamily)